MKLMKFEIIQGVLNQNGHLFAGPNPPDKMQGDIVPSLFDLASARPDMFRRVDDDTPSTCGDTSAPHGVRTSPNGLCRPVGKNGPSHISIVPPKS